MSCRVWMWVCSIVLERKLRESFIFINLVGIDFRFLEDNYWFILRVLVIVFYFKTEYMNEEIRIWMGVNFMYNDMCIFFF